MLVIRGSALQRIHNEITPLLAAELRRNLEHLSDSVWPQVEEIRIRLGKPLAVVTAMGYRFVAPGGALTCDPGQGYVVTLDDMRRTVEAISQSSWYALVERLRGGFVTIPGGHRLGLAGEAILDGSGVRSLKHVTSINLRIAREIIGCSEVLMPFLWDRRHQQPYHTLIVSPPGAGKTTILRDILRNFSRGIPRLGIPPQSIGLVDERWEIAACFEGVPRNDVGPCTDVLAGWPKAEGMLVLLRAMGPAIVATDEMGGSEDLAALRDVVNAGVKVVATVHSRSLTDLEKRAGWGPILKEGLFERYVILNRSLGPGTIETVTAADRSRILLQSPRREPSFERRRGLER